ncbi:MAG: histidine kinase [Eubacteriales bacterium]|nr:histidine kinase [Eubacteriales bacterium]
MKFNTVTKKIMAMIIGISIIVLCVLNIVFPSVFYRVMKPYLQKQVSSIVDANALRQSYIWRNNSQLYLMENSDELQQLILDYYNGQGRKEQVREEILTHLPVLNNGIRSGIATAEKKYGYIVSTNYLLLFTDKGDVFYNEQAAEPAQAFLESDWYGSVDKKADFFGHLPIIESGRQPDQKYFSVVASFRAGEINCFSVNLVRDEDILAQCEEFEEFGIEDYIIFCGSEILYRNLNEQSVIELEQYPEYMFEGDQYETRVWEDGNQTNFAVLCTYKKEDYWLAVNVPKNVLLAPYQEAFHYFQLFLGILVAVLLLLFCIALKGTLIRLTRLEKKMRTIHSGNYEVCIKDKSRDEIGSLADTFQVMLEKIREDMKYKEQMQYTLMVSAIDPHYIYNTLNTVTALAELGRNEDVVTVNDALIGTLKDRLRMKNYKTFDTVKAEQQALEQYMVIQSYLCFQKIKYTFDVSAGDQNLQIPKNVIQPLVENSIKHGILCKEYGESENQASLTVTVKRQKEDIFIWVQDNGRGMEEDTIRNYFDPDKVKARKPEEDMAHIGVYNVLMRLNYLYQGRYDLSVKSSLDRGTRICLILPIDQSGRDKDGLADC